VKKLKKTYLKAKFTLKENTHFIDEENIQLVTKLIIQEEYFLLE
jgi:hypothetical protein